MRANRLLLLGCLLAMVALAPFALWAFLAAASDWRWESEAPHSAIEAMGSMAAICVSIVLLHRKREPGGETFFLLGMGFLGMGLLDGLHAVVPPGQRFVFFRSAANVVGGLGFALVWLPQLGKYLSTREPVVWVVGGVCALCGICAILFPEAVPEMVRNGEFAAAAVTMNVLAGVLFLAGGLRLGLGFYRTGRRELWLFSCIAVLFSLSGFAFRGSSLWDAEWWLWHVLRLGAYALVAWYLADRYRQVERELRDLAKFPSENPHPVLRAAADGTVVYANSAAGLLLRVLGCGVDDVLPAGWRKANAGAVRTGTERKMSVEQDGRTISFSGIPVRKAGYVNWHGRDVTEKRQATAERKRLIAELEAKNAELERFAYTISHDLKSPLITIQAFVGQLEQGVQRNDRQRVRADVARIRAAAEKMQQLLDELLELSRIGRVVRPPEAFPLADVAREAVDLLAGVIGQRGVRVEIVAELPVVFADRRGSLMVVQNLVENAVKFMGDQAEPQVEIGARPERDEDSRAVCYVRDNGMGIDRHYQQRIFQIFDQLDRQSDGTGMGLAMVRRIVEVQGGRVWVESEGHGHGCTFCFTLATKAEQDSPAKLQTQEMGP